jgi:hypothetical protein
MRLAVLSILTVAAGSVDSVEIAPSRELKALAAMGMVERRDHQGRKKLFYR